MAKLTVVPAAQFAEEEEEAQMAPAAAGVSDSTNLRMHARVQRSRAHSSAARRRAASSANLHSRMESEAVRVEADTEDEQKLVVDSDEESDLADHFGSHQVLGSVYGLTRRGKNTPEDPALRTARLEQQAANLHRQRQVQQAQMRRAVTDPL